MKKHIDTVQHSGEAKHSNRSYYAHLHIVLIVLHNFKFAQHDLLLCLATPLVQLHASYTHTHIHTYTHTHSLHDSTHKFVTFVILFHSTHGIEHTTHMFLNLLLIYLHTWHDLQLGNLKCSQNVSILNVQSNIKKGMTPHPLYTILLLFCYCWFAWTAARLD